MSQSLCSLLLSFIHCSTLLELTSQGEKSRKRRVGQTQEVVLSTKERDTKKKRTGANRFHRRAAMVYGTRKHFGFAFSSASC